jgi:hypothetical protein
VDIKDVPNTSLAESDSDKVWEAIFNFGCLVCYLFSVCRVSPSLFLCVFYKLDEIARSFSFCISLQVFKTFFSSIIKKEHIT